jgi:Nucleotidyltransferase domain
VTATDSTERRELLDRRINTYHGASIAEVLETIAYLRDPGDSVLAGGSLAYGLGNERSDLDVVIAGDETTDSSSIPLEHWIDRLRVDVWKRKQSEIDEVFERAETALSSEVPFHGAFGDVEEQADLKFLHRIAHGIILDGPQLEPENTRDYREIARDLVVREYAERMRESIFVAQLALRTGSPIGAMTNARVAVEEALNADLAARGFPFSDNKWLWERLKEVGAPLESLYKGFAVLPETGEHAADLVAAAIEACQDLTGLELDADALAEAAVWEGEELELMKVGEERFLLSTKHGGLWKLDETEVAAWNDLVARERWRCAECDEIQMRLCFQLSTAGVMKLRWMLGLPPRELELGKVVTA